MVLAGLLLALVSAWLIATRLSVNTDTADMIDEDLSWRQDFLAFTERYPLARESLLVVVDGDSPEQTLLAAEAIATTLAAADTVEMLYAGAADDYFSRQRLLWLSPTELESLTARLAEAQPLLSMAGAGLTGGAVLARWGDWLDQTVVRGAELPPQATLQAIGRSLRALEQGQPVFLALSDMNPGGTVPGMADSDTGRRLVLVVKPVLDFSSLSPAAAALADIRQRMDKVDTVGARVRLSGGIVMQEDELNTAVTGIGWATGLALLLVALTLWLAFRSGLQIIAVLVGLVTGLLLTGGLAALTVGQLNLISIAFGVLYIGLGVDFAIHYLLRYRELGAAGQGSGDGALVVAATDTGPGLALSALTTAAAFLAFLTTDFRGVAELGLIAGLGMGVSLLLTLTLLPALIVLLPSRPAPAALRRWRPGQRWQDWVDRHYRSVLAATAVLFIAALLAVPNLEFDSDPLSLRDASSEAVTTFNELLADPQWTPRRLHVYAASRKQAETLATALRKLPAVVQVHTAASWVPADQDGKLQQIEQMRWFLGGPAVVPPALPLDDGLARLIAAVAAVENAPEALSDMGRAAGDLAQRWAAADPLARETLEQAANRALADSLVAQRGLLQTALGARPMDWSSLPADFQALWRSADDRWRVEILPAEDLADPDAMTRFIRQVRTVAPTATGLPMVYQRSGEVAVQAFFQAFGLAALAVVLVLWLRFRRWRDMAVAALPLLLALPLTAAAMVLFQIPLNFANLITLPLLLGIGIDTGIHLAERRRWDPRGLLASSTARAVWFSIVTTILSFGNLALAPHPGMAGMGQVLTLGMLMNLLAALLVLPALLAFRGSRTRSS